MAAQRKAYKIKPVTPQSPQKKKTSSKRRRSVIVDDTDSDEEGEEEAPPLVAEEVPAEEEEVPILQLEHDDGLPPHVHVAVEYNVRRDKSKLVKGALIIIGHLVEDAEDAPTELELYMAVVVQTLSASGRKVEVSYINDDESMQTDEEMVFSETLPPVKGSAWLGDVKYIMPPARVTKQQVDTEVEGEQATQWHIDIRQE